MIASASIAMLSAGCAQMPASGPQLDSARFADIDGAIGAVIADHRMPGAVFHLERNGQVYEKAYGRFTYDAGAVLVGQDTLFDAASLTKILSTAPSVLLLAEAGKIDLDAPLVRYFPECGGEGKAGITVRHLLTHSSGLPAGLPAKPAWEGQAAAHELACAKAVTDAPGTAFRYSDINYILLGQLVQRVSGMALNEFAQQHIFTPLKMTDTGYLPLSRFATTRIAPTHVSPASEEDKALHPGLAHGEVLQGVVHDPTSRRMGGVAGSAGVFTTAHDVARYARMLLADGELDGVRILSRESVRLMTTAQSPAGVAQLRGMGMDIDSPFARPRGTLFPVGSYGHTGFTGCILWVDPNSRTFYVFLSNRVYPDDKSNILPLYNLLGTLSAQSALGFDFGRIAPVTVPPGASTEAERHYEMIGKFIYGTSRAGFQLSLLMDRMGKPLVARAPGAPSTIAADAVEADAMFARLPAGAQAKAEFSALMQSLAMLAARLDRLPNLTDAELAESSAATAAVLDALPRYRAMIDHLLGPAATP